jgi:hypothetical protein
MVDEQKGMLMRRRIAEAAVVLVVGTMGVLAACSDDSTDPAPPSSSGGEGSQGGSAGEGPDPGAGSDGNGGSPVSAGGDGNPGGSPSDGGAPAGNAGAPTSNAGEGATPAEGGAGGNDIGPPDLIVKTGGPWPDSFTGSCSSTSAAIPCPQLDDPLFGQDGNYRINVPTYTSTVDTITDAVTGLMWQRKPEVASKTQVNAAAYCDALSLAAYDDWRLPTRLEYVTLLDEGLPNGFAVPPVVPTDSIGTQWTASATGRAADNYFAVRDEDGKINVADAATPYTARCVRGPALTGALTVGVDSVIDSMTNLEWQRTALEDEEHDWQEALGYCESLTHASKSDWRLPNIKELLTIIDETALTPPVVDAASFGDGSASRYWSSTPAPSFSNERFAVTLETGFGTPSDLKMTEFAAARCVRTPD